MSAINPAPPLTLESEGEDYLEKGMEAEAISSFAAAALMGRWEGWLRIAMILERRAKSENGVLSLFFRERYREAVEAAAGAGDNEAAHRTVGLYEFGQPGLSVDEGRALTLLKQLAQSGDAAAQFELFEKYLYGLCSAPKDKVAALIWLRMASDNGHEEAKKWLDGFEVWDQNGFEFPKR